MLRAMRAITQGCDLTAASTGRIRLHVRLQRRDDAFHRMSGLTATTLITMGLTIIVDRAEPADHCPGQRAASPRRSNRSAFPTASEHTMAQAVGLQGLALAGTVKLYLEWGRRSDRWTALREAGLPAPSAAGQPQARTAARPISLGRNARCGMSDPIDVRITFPQRTPAVEGLVPH